MDLRHIEERLTTILENAEGWLPTEQLADMKTLVRAGESGVALENFCTQLEEYDVAVPAHVVSELKALASLMRMKIPRWLERGGHA
jgi:hypothetical protein